LQNALRVKASKLEQLGTIVKQARIEKIGAHAAGLGFELTKTQHARFKGKSHKINGEIIFVHCFNGACPSMKKNQFRITSLNFNGIRSAATKGVAAWVETTAPDCMCVQEVKAQAADLGALAQLGGMQSHFQFAQKKGYSGVGVYTRHAPSDVIIGFDQGPFDAEGRYVELRFDTPSRKLSVISAYFPSGSSGPERQEAKFRFLDVIFPHLVALRKTREFVLCGDVNIAHTEKDLKNWKSNQKNSGFLPEERAWMTKLLDAGQAGGGLVDVYRQLHPDTTESCYTWWSQRGQAYAKNVGWRLDYHLATPAIAATAQEVDIYKAEKFSDHAPLSVGYAISL
jgi:exodeoxyribonuclease III